MQRCEASLVGVRMTHSVSLAARSPATMIDASGGPLDLVGHRQIVRQLAGMGRHRALHGGDPDFAPARPVGDEGDPVPVGRELGEDVTARCLQQCCVTGHGRQTGLHHQTLRPVRVQHQNASVWRDHGVPHRVGQFWAGFPTVPGWSGEAGLHTDEA